MDTVHIMNCIVKKHVKKLAKLMKFKKMKSKIVEKLRIMVKEREYGSSHNLYKVPYRKRVSCFYHKTKYFFDKQQGHL